MRFDVGEREGARLYRKSTGVAVVAAKATASLSHSKNWRPFEHFFGVLKHGFSFHDDRLCKVAGFSQGWMLDLLLTASRLNGQSGQVWRL